MFFTLSVCAVAPHDGNLLTGEKAGLKKIHYVAAGADVILGIVTIAIAILNTQYFYIGMGAFYSLGMLGIIGILELYARSWSSSLPATPIMSAENFHKNFDVGAV